LAPEWPPPGGEPAPTSAYRAAVRAFGEVAGALNEARDSDALLRLIGRHICELVGVERCSVYLKDEETGLFRGQVGWSRDPKAAADPKDDARIKRLIAGTEADLFAREIVETKRAVVVADAQTDPRPIRSTMRAWGVRSMLGVPMVLRGEVIGIIYLDEKDQPRTFTRTDSELASTFAELAAVAVSQAQMTTRLRHSLRTAARQNELLRRASAIDEKLTALVLAGANLAEIAEAVAELTGKPCEIYDPDHRRLAAAAPPWSKGGTPTRSFDRAIRNHPAVDAALKALGDKGSGVIGPLPEAGLTHRCLVSSITTRDDVWGQLAIMEYGSRFGALDAHIARRAATNVALELAAERRAARAEWDARASLAGELIRGTSDANAVTRRAEYLGVDLLAPHVVCLVGALGEGVLPSTADIAARFAARRPGRAVLATAVAEGVLVILQLDGDLPPLEGIAATRTEVQDVLDDLGGGALVAAIASRCTAAGDYVRAYAEAGQVMRCLQSFAEGERSLVLTADDLGPGRLFLASSSPAEADRFVQDALGPLLEPGQTAIADLLETLDVFFKSSRSVRNAAQHLGVHENTIRYRLARIQDLTGLAVGSDSGDELTAHLALLILRVRKLLGHQDAQIADR
jgi:sugar diacid utilization regulator